MPQTIIVMTLFEQGSQITVFLEKNSGVIENQPL